MSFSAVFSRAGCLHPINYFMSSFLYRVETKKPPRGGFEVNLDCKQLDITHGVSKAAWNRLRAKVFTVWI